MTVWTQRPEDEHRVLSSLLAGFLKYERLPDDVLPGRSRRNAAQPHGVALPPPKERSLADLWSALGGELKPSLDLVVTAPFDAGRVVAAGPPVLVQPSEVRRPRRHRADAGAREAPRRQERREGRDGYER